MEIKILYQTELAIFQPYNKENQMKRTKPFLNVLHIFTNITKVTQGKSPFVRKPL